jgi:hypothetical protein
MASWAAATARQRAGSDGSTGVPLGSKLGAGAEVPSGSAAAQHPRRRSGKELWALARQRLLPTGAERAHRHADLLRMFMQVGPLDVVGVWGVWPPGWAAAPRPPSRKAFSLTDGWWCALHTLLLPR